MFILSVVSHSHPESKKKIKAVNLIEVPQSCRVILRPPLSGDGGWILGLATTLGYSKTFDKVRGRGEGKISMKSLSFSENSEYPPGGSSLFSRLHGQMVEIFNCHPPAAS